MPDTLNSPWLNPPSDGKRFAAALGLGLLLELAAICGLIPALSHQPPPADTPAPIRISIIAPAPAPPPPPAPPKPTPLPPKPVVPPPPQPVAPPIPMPPPPPMPRPSPHVVRHYIKPRVQTPPPPVPTPPVAQTPPAPPPPPAPAAPSGGQVDMFRAAIKRAVQSVADQVYPSAAQMAHETGEPVIAFTYLNGTITNVTLVQPSGFPLLDAAALQAVRIAPYPAPPAAFANHSYTWMIAVEFHLAAASVDGD